MSAIANTITDEKILELLRDERSFEQGFKAMIHQYKERLYWQIRRIVVHHEDADDVLQNTFIKVYRGILQFEEKSKLYTWLYRIATNEALTHVSSQQRKQTTSIDDVSSMLENKLRADDWFDGDEVQIRLQQAVAALPDKQKQVFTLRYFNEMPYEEMAGLLDTSVGALKASFHHAAKKIEAHFKGTEN